MRALKALLTALGFAATLAALMLSSAIITAIVHKAVASSMLAASEH
ncbi:MAG TPA: hypothetical protein VJ740_06770 [Hyphomicrobiaceae bacterium]|jgi:hypothetical protein|nr:hypothetical protein [Hyphomicrobiaceae bacterium]